MYMKIPLGTLYTVRSKHHMLKQVFVLFLLVCVGNVSAQHVVPSAVFRQLQEDLEINRFEADWMMVDLLASVHKTRNLDKEDRDITQLQQLAKIKSGGTEIREEELNRINWQEDGDLAYALGNYFLGERDYSTALKYFQGYDYYQLAKGSEEDFQRQIAYCYMGLGFWEDALSQLNSLKGDQYRYYIGWILHRQGKFQEAIDQLEPIDYQPEVVPLLADSYWQEGQVDDMINYLERRLPLFDEGRQKKVILKKLGNAYFELEAYDKAVAYFENSSLPLTRQEQFKAGYGYLVNGDPHRAIEKLSEARETGGLLGQLAGFYCGKAHLLNDEPTQAFLAFQEVSIQNYNQELTEQASFLSGKIQIQNGAYALGIEILEKFVDEFPQSKRSGEANELLAEAWFYTPDYARAISHLESLPVLSNTSKAYYQQINLLLGKRRYNQGQFHAAIRSFNKSLRFPEAEALVFEAKFWIGESYVALEEPERAEPFLEESLRGSVPLASRSAYALGYLYLKKQGFEKAAYYFQQALEGLEDEDLKVDAKFRWADTQFAMGDFDEAKAHYESLEGKSGNQDYLLYQLGYIDLLQKDYESAVMNLSEVTNRWPSSVFADDALRKIGETYFELGLLKAADSSFSVLIHSQPSSEWLPLALLKRGLLKLNTHDTSSAVTDFQEVIQKFPQKGEALQALLSLQELESQGAFTLADLERITANFKRNNPSLESHESLDFNQIKNYYFRGHLGLVSQGAIDFLNRYPQSTYNPEILYYHADALFQDKQYEAALVVFDKMLTYVEFAYFNRALEKRGNCLLELTQYELAIANYYQLQLYSRNTKELNRAHRGLMLAYAYLNEDSAFHYAEKVAYASITSPSDRTKAKMLLLKIAVSRGDEKSLKRMVEELARDPGEEGAEALYRQAIFLREQEDFESSNQALFELTARKTEFPLWNKKAYLLLVDNFISMGKWHQAEATNQSILDQTVYPDWHGPALVQKQKIDSLRQANRQKEVLTTVEEDSLQK